jgi:hypothetical protein
MSRRLDDLEDHSNLDSIFTKIGELLYHVDDLKVKDGNTHSLGLDIIIYLARIHREGSIKLGRLHKVYSHVVRLVLLLSRFR